MDQLEGNLDALAVTLTPEQIAKLDAASAPTLDFPAENHRELGPMLGFGGATVDGVQHPAWPALVASATRY